MKTLRLKRLTRARMEQWLRENQNAGDYAKFDICSSRSCPVAHFIIKTYPRAMLYSVGIDGGDIETRAAHGKVRRFHLPMWARKFINRVDGMNVKSGKISGQQALEILTSI